MRESQEPSSSRQRSATSSPHIEEDDKEASANASLQQLKPQTGQHAEDAQLQRSRVAPAEGVGSRSYHKVTVEGSSKPVLGDIHANNVAFNSYHATDPSRKSTCEALMKALAFDGMGSREATIAPAHANTCLWILKTLEYVSWRNPRERNAHHGILWIKGNPGVGKSTLMKRISNHAQEHFRQNETVVCFFFNGRGFQIERSTEGMYRSLLFQILEALPRMQEILASKVTAAEPDTWSIDILQDLFRTAILSIGPDEHLSCYVDALDECHVDEIRQVISTFEDLGQLAVSKNIRLDICFASRRYSRHH